MKLNWSKIEGLVPAVIQDFQSREVLMLGYMNEEALRLTQETGWVTFYSRSRKKLWIKGETSGNALQVVEILPDCDEDTLLIRAVPQGPTCHRNTPTCFDNGLRFLSSLEQVIQERMKNPSSRSYVSQLTQSGLDRITQKVGEEAIETVIASKNPDLSLFEGECADLLFHLMVLLQAKGTSLTRVASTLMKRHKK